MASWICDFFDWKLYTNVSKVVVVKEIGFTKNDQKQWFYRGGTCGNTEELYYFENIVYPDLGLYSIKVNLETSQLEFDPKFECLSNQQMLRLLEKSQGVREGVRVEKEDGIYFVRSIEWEEPKGQEARAKRDQLIREIKSFEIKRTRFFSKAIESALGHSSHSLEL